MTSELDLLIKQPQSAGQETNLDIVVIPAIRLSKPTEWLDAFDGWWLKHLAQSRNAHATVWAYSYSSKQTSSIPTQLINEGVTLLEALSNLCNRSRKKVPIIFICHGTGGLLLKKTLCLCREQYHQYRHILDLVSGFIFLGSPHFTQDIVEAQNCLDLLLTFLNGGNGRSRSRQNEVKHLIEVCKTFETFMTEVPILSAYESMETINNQGFFSKLGRKGRGPAVPQSLGTLKVRGERSIDSESDHINICNVSMISKLYKACQDLVRDVMKRAPRRIAENDRPYEIPGALKSDSLRSPSTAGWTRIQDMSSHDASLSNPSPIRAATGTLSGSSYEHVATEVNLDVAIRDPKLPCYMLGDHCQKDYFAGRETILKRIDDHLLYPISQDMADPGICQDTDFTLGLRSFAICGLGGIGKTELAIQYAHTRKNQFEAIFWLKADDSKVLASDFANIAVRLGLEDDISLDITASRDIVMGWLAKPLRDSTQPDDSGNYVKWLLIFDNVDNLDVLADFWPNLGSGSVLVTSRDPNAKQNIHIHHGLHLPPLTNAETENLLQKLTNVTADGIQQEALAKIAQELDGLPLVVNQISGLIRSLRLSYVDFLKYLQKYGIERFYERQLTTTDSGKIQSLVTLWALDRLPPPTKALLEIICLLDPDDIPEDVLIDNDHQVELPGYPTDMESYYSARSELLSSSLVNQMNNNKLSLHRLVQDATKTMMGPERLAQAFQSASKLLVSAWPFQSIKEHHSTVRFGKCEMLFSSVLRFKDGLQAMLPGDINLALDLSIARLFNDTGWYMFERGLQEQTKPFCELALEIAKSIKNKDSAEAAECIREIHSVLGIALVETNEHRLSMQHKDRWLKMLLERRSESGSAIEDYELGYAYNEIGVAHGNKGDIEKAIDAFIRSIQIFQGLEDYEDIMLGWPEPNLGFMYWLKGDLDKAETALVEILDIHAAKWGVDDTHSFKTGKILYGLGNVLESKGQFSESLEFHVRCLQQYKAVLGMKHHRVGDVCHRLAGHYMRLELYEEARGYIDTALEIFQSRSYLINEYARTAYRKSQLLELLGNHDEAREVMEKAYKARRIAKPGDPRSMDKLVERDYDELVAFWSR
ncbi:hypothetical protein FPOAC2_13183 [Fusarium poae]|uniref:hypothetical protein n=1 Tax=Fusarium poae TaxID=36050 RepID=UPI001CEB07ED|nr:hypothetical protein FPOAC1_012811 [Fusarium poae]KAG8667969.1 hypothetical protein FPOAC1_012811 [Fusarium poae]